MPDLTRDDVIEICKDVCPSCKAGVALRRRDDTGEHVHDFVIGHTGYSHAYCLASHFREKHRELLDG